MRWPIFQVPLDLRKLPKCDNLSYVNWLKDKSLTDLENLPEPDELAEEIIENLEAGLNSFREVLSALPRSA